MNALKLKRDNKTKTALPQSPGKKRRKHLRQRLPKLRRHSQCRREERVPSPQNRAKPHPSQPGAKKQMLCTVFLRPSLNITAKGRSWLTKRGALAISAGLKVPERCFIRWNYPKSSGCRHPCTSNCGTRITTSTTTKQTVTKQILPCVKCSAGSTITLRNATES